MEDHAQPMTPEGDIQTPEFNDKAESVDNIPQNLVQGARDDVMKLVGPELNSTRSIHKAMYPEEEPQTLAA